MLMEDVFSVPLWTLPVQIYGSIALRDPLTSCISGQQTLPVAVTKWWHACYSNGLCPQIL